MTRKSKGFIELEWACPNCETRNKGSLKVCGSCGAPQPENVQFEAPAEKKFVGDEKASELKKRGADVHCGFCGTRNESTAQTCSQCGADLSEGTARKSGRQIDMSARPRPEKLICSNCGKENSGSSINCVECGAPLPKPVTPGPAASSAPPVAVAAGTGKKKPSRKLFGAIGAALLLCCIAVASVFFIPTSSVEATVTDVYWKTSVPVEEIQPVEYTNKQGNPPSDAYNVSCETKKEEVCEEKTIDRGDGFAEVVEECHTETDKFCDYTVDEWTTVQTYTLDGYDFYPVYEQPSVSSGQRLGDESVDYTVYFDTDKGEKVYSPDDLDEFQQFDIGSRWTLKLNLLGHVRGISK